MFREFWNLDTTTQQLHHVGHHIPIQHTVRVEISTIYSLLKQSVCLKYGFRIFQGLRIVDYYHPDGPKLLGQKKGFTLEGSKSKK